jgi:hypothetical protein
MAGNHTDKHMGALASAAFVESKYKMCLYFSSEVYEEQMQLRAMALFAKEGKAREQPPPPSTEDKVKNALRRQTMLPKKAPEKNEEKVLLRGFGSTSPKDKECGDEEEEEEFEEEEHNPHKRRSSGVRPNLERRVSVARRGAPRRTKSADCGIPLGGPQRRTKKPISDGRAPARRSNTHEFDSSSHRSNNSQRDYDSRSRRNLDVDGQRRPRGHHRVPSDPEGLGGSSGHRRRGHRSADTDPGTTSRFRRTNTVADPTHRNKSGPGLRRNITDNVQKPRRVLKNAEMSSSRHKAPRNDSRGEETPSRSMPKRRERSRSPARSRSGRKDRSLSPKDSTWERPGRKERSRSPNPKKSYDSKSDDGPEIDSSFDENSTVGVSSPDNSLQDDPVEKRESWTNQVDRVTWCRGKAKEMERGSASEGNDFSGKESITENGSVTKKESKTQIETNDDDGAWTETFDDSVMWSRNTKNPTFETRKKRSSGKVVGENKLDKTATAIFQKAFTHFEETAKTATPPSWVDELAHASEHDLGADIPGFSSSFTDMGFEEFGTTHEGLEDNNDDDDNDTDDDAADSRLLSGITLSSF